MDKILNLEGDFDIKLFDTVVNAALNNSDANKKQAEDVLLQFKDLPNSWTKVDFILKNSQSQQSKFIALQILEENVRRKWSTFNEQMKTGIRQYVFSYIVSNANVSQSDIVLKKFNSILVNIVKRDWPKKWPTFVNDLISISQSTSMLVCANALEILKSVNEQAFQQTEDMVEAKKLLLRSSLQQEYGIIFSFLVNILEYSEKQEMETQLLKNCFSCFSSFCGSMPAEYIFSTRVVEIICQHLNSAYSIEVLKCLLEIMKLFTVKGEDEEISRIQIPQGIEKETVYKKINFIHSELLAFFKLYMEKFENENELSQSFNKFDDLEKLFIKSYSRCFCAIYSNFFDLLNVEDAKIGLVFLKNISKIPDIDLFREIFSTWRILIYNFYSEFPMRSRTAKHLKRSEFSFVLISMFPVFISFMPRPEEVFIIINDLGEVVKDKNVQTADIEFSKRMKENFYYLSFCIKDEIIKHLINATSRILQNTADFDHVGFNKLCWTIGCYAGAFDIEEEKDFFLNIMKMILTFCECVMSLEQKAIIASNIMFIIGQYKRVLKNNIEFTQICIFKLFEFMEEDFEGIKEMACDNMLRICENCPSQFFKSFENRLIFESVLQQLPSTAKCLDFYLQRILIEGLFSVLNANSVQKQEYVNKIIESCTDINLINFNPEPFASLNGVKAVCHLFESYCIGFAMLPAVMRDLCNKSDIVKYYSDLNMYISNNSSISTNLVKIVKNSAVNLFIEISQTETDEVFLNQLTEYVLFDYKNTFYSSIIKLTSVILKNGSSDVYTQRVIFTISNIILPSVPLINAGDSNPDVAIELSLLMCEMIKENDLYCRNIPLLMSNPQFDGLYSAILFTVGCMKEISDNSLNFLLLLFRKSFECNNQEFFNRCLLTTLENIVGLIIDKDTRQNHELQVDLLYEMIFISKNIPSVSSGTENQKLIDDYLANLFKNAFKNVTENSFKIFIKGIFEIRNKQMFLAHVDDFTVKIYEVGTDEDLDDEVKMLERRINTN
ncbi:Xpo1 [Nucleospora cyclopteri]